MVDTNPFANNTQQTSTNSTGQQPMTAAGGVANMIKAIMEGNDAYKQRQQQMMGQQGMKQPGPPMSLAPPQDPTNPSGTGTSQPVGLSNPTTQTGGVGGGIGGFMSMPQQGLASMLPNMGGAASMFTNPGGAMDAFTSGNRNSGVAVDPVTQALMSPIPGM